MEAGPSHGADQASGPTVVVRPFLLVGIGLVIGAALAANLLVRQIPRDGWPRAWGDVAGLGLLVVWPLAVLARERIVLDGTRVRIIRLFSQDDVARSDIVAVHRGGGKGKPTFVATSGDHETRSSWLHARGPSRRNRQPRALAMPVLISPAQLATALDVPCLTYSGRLPGPPPEVTFRRFSSREGVVTWVLTAGLVALIAMMVIGTLLSL